VATREHAASAVDRVTSALRDAILEGDLGGGERLVEQRLAEHHAAARHTVRAALRALAAEGLVVLAPHRGASVARLDEPAVLALYQLRTALEVEAARVALHRHGGRLPAAVHRAAGELAHACAVPEARWADVTARHGAVHEAVVAAAHSPRIAQAHAALEGETRLFLLQVRPAWPLRRLADDHLALIADLEAGGPDALRAHLRASAAELVDAADLA
jgi:DNA-binding GntR family transcriptional regulator